MSDAIQPPLANLGGKYRLDGVLGSGGMGTVYAAEHLLLRKRVAIKVLHDSFSSEPELTERFLREARIVTRLEHPGVIRVLDVAQAESGLLYMVMELLEGESLGGILDREITLSVSDTAAIVATMLDALAFAHRAGVIHRDLKPDNVFLLQSTGVSIDLRVLDFGISKQLNTISPSPRLTQTGTILGTPYYMSPEQARGEPSIDHRSDIWSIGVMLYQMLSGQLPYAGDSYNQILVAIVVDPVAPLTTVTQGLPPGLIDVVSRCLEKEPSARYQSAEALQFALKPFLKDGGRVLELDLRPTPPIASSGVPAAHLSLGTAETLAANAPSECSLSDPVLARTQRAKPASAANVAQNGALRASFWRRAVALAIDVFIFGLVIGQVIDGFDSPDRVVEVRVDEAKVSKTAGDGEPSLQPDAGVAPTSSSATKRPGIAITGRRGETVTLDQTGVTVVRPDGGEVSISTGEDAFGQGRFDGIRLLVDELQFTFWFPNPLKTSLWVLYCTLFLAFFAATPGKMVAGLRVQELGRGAPKLSLMAALIRSAFFVLSIIPLGLGCLWSVLGQQRRTWHDMIAKTEVVRTSRVHAE